MAWWNRKPARSPAVVLRARSEGVTASAQRFDLDVPADREQLAKLQQQWQQDILVYADTIGEFTDSATFVENSFRRIGLTAAFQRTQDEEPIPVMDATQRPDGDAGKDFASEDVLDEKWATLAEEILAGFAARDGGQAALVARLGRNLFSVGEAIILQRAVLERRPRVDETKDEIALIPKVLDWEIRSVFEIRKARSGRAIETVDSPDQREGVPIVGEDGSAGTAYVERVWRKHWAWSGWATSNARSATGVLEELRLLDLVARASLRSRVMAHMFKVPQELDFSATDLPDGTPGAVKGTVTFERMMSEAFSAGIGNEADPNTVAPLVVSGPSAFLGSDVFGWVETPRRYGADERAQREEAVRRFARTIELPQEKILGTQDQNHWGAWLVDEDTYRAYIEPLALIVTEALTYGLLRPLLETDGCPPEVLDRILVVPETSRLVRRADRGKLATEGYGLRTVSAEGWRRANGFGDDDAPDDDELALRAAVEGRADGPTVAALLVQAGVLDEAPAPVPTSGQQPAPAGDQPAADDGGDRQIPAPPEAVAAALDVIRSSTVGSRLAAIDSTLFARLITQADQAVTRVLEKIGAGLRSRKTNANAELKAALSVAQQVNNADLAAHLPVTLVAATLGPAPVIAEDFEDLRVRFDRWTDAAQETAVRELARLAGTRVTDAQIEALRAEQQQDRDDAWAYLAAALVGFTQSRLVRAENEMDTSGEWEPSAVVAPATIWAALALAGGTSIEHTSMGGVERTGGGVAGGPATGDRMRVAFGQAGHPFLGYEWEYGSAPRQQPFEPHLSLDGAPDTEWQGYQPLDHAHCRCASVPIVDERGPDDA